MSSKSKPIYLRQTRFKLQGKVWKSKDSKYFLASCDSLGLMEQGRTKQKARSNLQKALYGFVEVHARDGVLWDVLRSCNVAWRFSPKTNILDLSEHRSIPLNGKVPASTTKKLVQPLRKKELFTA